MEEGGPLEASCLNDLASLLTPYLYGTKVTGRATGIGIKHIATCQGKLDGATTVGDLVVCAPFLSDQVMGYDTKTGTTTEIDIQLYFLGRRPMAAAPVAYRHFLEEEREGALGTRAGIPRRRSRPRLNASSKLQASGTISSINGDAKRELRIFPKKFTTSDFISPATNLKGLHLAGAKMTGDLATAKGVKESAAGQAGPLSRAARLGI